MKKINVDKLLKKLKVRKSKEVKNWYVGKYDSLMYPVNTCFEEMFPLSQRK